MRWAVSIWDTIDSGNYSRVANINVTANVGVFATAWKGTLTVIMHMFGPLKLGCLSFRSRTKSTYSA